MMEAKLRPSLLLFLTSVTLLLLLEHCEASAIDFIQCDRRAPGGLLQDGSGSVRDSDCFRTVQQSPVRLVGEVSQDTPSSGDVIKVFPGQVFKLNIYALDQYGMLISTVITGSVTTSDGRCSYAVRPLFGSTGTANFAVLESWLTTVPVRMFGSENQTVTLVISSSIADPAGLTETCLKFNISLLSCGFGFKFNPSNQTCICDNRIYSRSHQDVTCDIETYSIKVQDDAWIGPYKNETFVDRCLLFGYCKPGRRKISIRANHETDFDVQCDNRTNRSGFLCSECRKNFSAVLGTRNCKQCSNWYLFLFVFFIVIGVVAIVVVRYLNITITAGYINGAIFYSNIVSIFGYYIVPGRTYNEALALISFPTLNLGVETCLYDGMTILQKVLLQLSFPVYLFVLMFIITLLVRTKLWKMNRSAGSSTTRSFATLLILCYVSVLGTCSELIAFNRIYTIEGKFILQWRSDPSVDYFGNIHAAPGVIAVVILALYILPLPVFLLFPAVLYRTKYSSRFKPIYDAFWYPYKPRYRFFLGLRLIFRWLPFFLVAAVRPPISVFVTQFFLILLLLVQCTVQPYQEKWQNYVDGGFVCNLVLLFSGSVLFWSEFNSADSDDERLDVTRRSLIYSNTLIVLGFLMILGVIVYHIYMRFTKLQQWKARLLRKKSFKIKRGQSRNGDDYVDAEGAPDFGDAAKDKTNPENQDHQNSLRNTVTELREPLLESGSIKLDTISYR